MPWTDEITRQVALGRQAAIDVAEPGHPIAPDLVAVAKYWASYGGSRVGHAGLHLHGVTIGELRLPRGAVVGIVVRDQESLVPAREMRLRHGDQLLIVVPRSLRAGVERRVGACRAGRQREHSQHGGQEHGGSGGVIVFDESSRAIPPDALDEFYGHIKLLASQGTSVLFVSHNLREVLKIADRVTALRNGKVVEMGVPTSTLDEASITRLVLGKDGDLDNFVETMPSHIREGGLTLRDVAGGRAFGLRSHISRGEVVGYTGNLDSGLSSVGPLIAGAFPGGGDILVDGKVVKRSKSSSRKMVDAGVAFIPQDRHGLGLATPLTVQENVTLPLELMGQGRQSRTRAQDRNPFCVSWRSR